MMLNAIVLAAMPRRPENDVVCDRYQVFAVARRSDGLSTTTSCIQSCMIHARHKSIRLIMLCSSLIWRQHAACCPKVVEPSTDRLCVQLMQGMLSEG